MLSKVHLHISLTESLTNSQVSLMLRCLELNIITLRITGTYKGIDSIPNRDKETLIYKILARRHLTQFRIQDYYGQQWILNNVTEDRQPRLQVSLHFKIGNIDDTRIRIQRGRVPEGTEYAIS